MWLWRYKLPLEYSVAADSKDIAQRFVLVRSLLLSHTDDTSFSDILYICDELSTPCSPSCLCVSMRLNGMGFVS